MGLAVGGEAHHLVLVAEAEEAQVLGDGGVEEPQRVREVDAVEDAQVAASPDRRHRRDEVAEAVDREAHRPLERRAEEGRAEVGEVVLDRIETGRPAPECLRHALLERAHLGEVPHPRDGAPAAPRVAEGEGGLAQEIGARLARDGERRDLAQAAHLLQAVADGELREARPVLDPPEALLLDAGDEPPVDHRRRRGIGMEGVDPEDAGAVAHGLGTSDGGRRSSASRMSTTRRNQKAWRKWKTNPSRPSRKPQRMT